MTTEGIIAIELGALLLVVFLLGAGLHERLKHILDAINQNHKDSLVHPMARTDLRVVPPKEKIRNPCECGHTQAVHWRVLNEHGAVMPGEGPCHSLLAFGKDAAACQCGEYTPKRKEMPRI